MNLTFYPLEIVGRAPSHYNVLDKARLTFLKMLQNAEERWRSEENAEGHGEFLTMDISQICNFLVGTHDEHSVSIDGGRNENADGRTMDGGHPSSALRTFLKRPQQSM